MASDKEGLALFVRVKSQTIEICLIQNTDIDGGYGMPKTKILSCVGKRPLAVIMPIHAVLKSKHLSAEEVEIILICTDKTIDIGSKCCEWFKKEFPKIAISDPVLFDNRCEFLNNLIGSDDAIYLNTNPAMNWEISLICLNLPKHTLCIASDNDYCYIWKLIEDAQSSDRIELKNIGLDTLAFFSEMISKISISQEDNTHISKQIKACLADLSKKGKSFKIRIANLPENISQRINRRLIWIKENKGRLYLLFDMVDDMDTGSLLDDFRLITAVFDPLNYTITLASNKSKVIERAKIEGIDYIKLSGNPVWHNDIGDWINGRWNITPKAIIPDYSPSAALNISSSKLPKINRTLCVCIGDNIEPTLKAILSHPEIDSISLFFDSTSPKMRLLAKNVAIIYKTKNKHISLIPTDHRGSGIVKNITDISKQKIKCVINITPGTKMQSVAFSSAAIVIDCLNEVYSIYRDSSAGKETIRRLLDSQDCADVISPEVRDLLNCFFVPIRYDGALSIENERILSLNIWKYILDEIASNRMKAFKNFTDFENYNKRYKVQLHDDQLIFNNKTYKLNPSFMDRDGIWWETTVGYAVSQSLNDKIYWQTIWDWVDDKGQQYAEIDVVAKYKNHILAISCKTMKRNLYNAVYMIKSEAAKRFGRFSVPLLAIPHEEHNGKKLGGSIIEGVAILTPSILKEKQKLLNFFNEFLSSLSTTSRSVK